MTENIQHSINEIRTKALGFRDELIAMKVQNEELQKELLALNEKCTVNADELSRLQTENAELKAEMDAMKSQVVDSPYVPIRNEEEIDELVKEIEYCIGQLKK